MPANDNWLLCHRFRAIADGLVQGGDADALWVQAEEALADTDAEEDVDIALPVLDRSLSDLQALIRTWDEGSGHLCEWDRAVLKRALKAYRKRLKIARLDEESSSGRNPLSKGESSSILGVRPPEQYAPEIWAMLVAQGKLRDAGHGLLELAT